MKSYSPYQPCGRPECPMCARFRDDDYDPLGVPKGTAIALAIEVVAAAFLFGLVYLLFAVILPVVA